MAMPRKNPPHGAVAKAFEMAAKGYTVVGIAKEFGVSSATFRRWQEDYEDIDEAFRQGRESERQALHAMIVEAAKANKGANANAMFLLKTRHGYIENDKASQQVNVAIANAPVMLVTDLGTDTEWAAKAAEQQKRLMEQR